MQVGICTGPSTAATVQAVGWDYIEGAVPLFKGEEAMDEAELNALRQTVLPMPACNMLVPGHLKITGEEVDRDKLKQYMTNVLQRAGAVGATTLVFGSGGARNVPEGFDRNRARDQIIDFCTMSAPIAGDNGVTIVIEPLNKGECNIINSVAEGMEYVRAVNHNNFRCLVDSYHFWKEDEPLAHLEDAMPWIAHVHVADKIGRTAPGESGE